MELDGIRVERTAVGRHQANAYLVYRESGEDAILIDPGAEASRLMASAQNAGVHIAAILLTHGHWDHVGAAKEIGEHAAAPVYLHSADTPLLKASPLYAFRIDGV